MKQIEESAYLGQYILTNHAPDDRRGMRRVSHRLRLGRMFKQLEQIFLESPCLRINLL
jgi:hypothetical protein